MKRLTLYIFMLVFVLILSACTTGKMPSDDNYHFETDYPYSFFQQGNGLTITPGEDGYYILQDKHIYYVDEDTMEPVFLDNRPDNDCSTTNDNCDAAINFEDIVQTFIQYYDNHIYTLEALKDFGTDEDPLIKTNYELVRRDSDGTNQKVIKKFGTTYPSHMAIHRGYIYYVTDDYSKDDERSYQVLRNDLRNLKGEPELLYEGKYERGSIADLIPYGAQIYITEFTDAGYRPLRYDLNDQSLTELWNREDGSSVGVMDIYDDKVYFQYYYGKGNDGGKDERNVEGYFADLDGTNVERLPITPSTTFISSFYKDKYYVYQEPTWVYAQDYPELELTHELTVYKDNEEVGQVDLSKFSMHYTLAKGDDQYMFIRYTGAISDKNVIQTYFLDKNDITSGKAEFKLLLETKFNHEG